MLRGGAPAFSLGPGTSCYRKIEVNPSMVARDTPWQVKLTILVAKHGLGSS
jgi:hypothetical protein